MNEKLLFIHCLKLHQIIHDTTASTRQQVLAKGYHRLMAYRPNDRGGPNGLTASN